MSTTQTTRPTKVASAPIEQPSAGSTTPAPTRSASASMFPPSGRDQTPPQASTRSTPIVTTPAGTKTGRDQPSNGTHSGTVSAPNPPGDQSETGTQDVHVAGDQDQPTAIRVTQPIASSPSAASPPPAATVVASPRVAAPQVGDPFLALAADVVDDLEKVRIANENRLRQLTRSDVDADGEERGFGLTEDHPDVARLAALVDMLGQAEHQGVLNLQRLMRKHALGPWVKATKGVGEKQAARLLGAIGDPYIRPEITRADGTVELSRPRTVSELWAYCGLHVLPAGQRDLDNQQLHASGNQAGSHPDQRRFDAHTGNVGVAPKRQKGQRANWSTVAKTRAYLAAEAVVKATVRKLPEVDDSKGYDFAHRMATTLLGQIYLDTRAKYTDAIHKVPCPRCGPSGKPAPTGSPLSDGHKHARAMRAVSKAVLKELWRESKRLHEGGA